MTLTLATTVMCAAPDHEDKKFFKLNFLVLLVKSFYNLSNQLK